MSELPGRQWLEPAAIDPPHALIEAVGGHKLLAEHLVRKGIATPAAAMRFLHARHYQPASAFELPDIEPAVERLQGAIDSREKILVWGDFDVDGQTATALLYSALQQRGAQVAYHVPNRFDEGHGIHLPTLSAKLDGGSQLLLTCDTGSSAHEAAELCARHGVDMLISDHHALPAQLPVAAAHINPQRLPAGHPLRELPGVGVAYKLIEALDGGGECASLLDLVALGIVADVMAQVDDTRYLLQRGLDVLRENRRPGLRAILERAEIPPAELNEGHIGFAIAPRLNALGRLEDANPAVELLTTNDWQQAQVMAHRLDGFNNRRKYLSEQVYQSAMAQLDAKPWLLDYAALVLSHESWHSGVIGIVASRLVEETGKPALLMATHEGLARGSARSIAGLDINAALGQVAHLLKSHGGHSMAAGFSLSADKIIDFRRELSRVARAMDIPPAPPLQIDGILALDELSLELARDIERLAPFGNGNPSLRLMSRDLKVASQKTLGRDKRHLQLEIEDSVGSRQRVVYWRGAGKPLPTGRFDLAYTLRTSSWKGQPEAMIEWLYSRAHDRPALEPDADESPYAIDDYRQCLDPWLALAKAREQRPEAQIWAEVDAVDGALDRSKLQSGETLIVWTAPASAQIWEAALATVSPRRLVLIGVGSATESPNAFLARLYGLAKYRVNHGDGMATLDELAAACGQTERTAQVGLQLLRAQGRLDFALRAGGRYKLRMSDAPPSDKLDIFQRRLTLLLRESRAYRKYWRKANQRQAKGMVE